MRPRMLSYRGWKSDLTPGATCRLICSPASRIRGSPNDATSRVWGANGRVRGRARSPNYRLAAAVKQWSGRADCPVAVRDIEILGVAFLRH